MTEIINFLRGLVPTTTEIINFLRGLIPTTTQIEIGAVVSMAGTTVTYALGWDKAAEALVYAMVIDYISGLMAAYINQNLSLNSQKGFKGIAKKVMILLLVSLAHFVDTAIGQHITHTAVIWFFIGNEGLSIIENAAKIGVPIPNKLKASLEQLATEKRSR